MYDQRSFVELCRDSTFTWSLVPSKKQFRGSTLYLTRTQPPCKRETLVSNGEEAKMNKRQGANRIPLITTGLGNSQAQSAFSAWHSFFTKSNSSLQFTTSFSFATLRKFLFSPLVAPQNSHIPELDAPLHRQSLCIPSLYTPCGLLISDDL